jgi:hypothetical protein
MRTLIVSDLHLGSASRADVLRARRLRAPLAAAAARADRLVLLGDTLELRHGPARNALAVASPVLSELGGALTGREVVLCPGNHDHALTDPWLRRRSELAAPTPLGVEERVAAAEVSPALAELARMMAPATLTLAYPGLWVRPDVYATHGHYLDCHVTIPTLERLGIGAMNRILGRPSTSLRCPDDYESVGGPLFAWIDAVARQGPTGAALNGSMTVRAWHSLGGGDSTHSAPAPRRPGPLVRERIATLAPSLRRRALMHAFPLVVAVLNRAGMGPLRADISPGELRRAGLRAMGEVAARLELGDAYVVFGHTHRAGPLPGDEDGEWLGGGGARLVNTGCWTYERAFLSTANGAERNPYWPGTCVVVDEHGPPRIERLLAHLHHDELIEAMRAAA